MKTKNQTNTKRIERIEKQLEEMWKVLDEITPWNFQRPIGPKYREIPISPEFPDFGKITVIDTEPAKGLRDRVREG